MSDQEGFDPDLTPSQEHTIAFAVILIFGAMYLFFMKGCQPIASSMTQAFGPPQTAQLNYEPSNPDRLSGKQRLESESRASGLRVNGSDEPVAYTTRPNDINRSVDKENANNAQTLTSTTTLTDSHSGEVTGTEQVNLDQQIQAREAAKIKVEAASLVAATAAQKLADDKRFQAKQAEIKAAKAKVVIPAKPVERAPTLPANSAVKPPNEQPVTKSSANSQLNSVNAANKSARLNFTLPDGRHIRIPEQGFENRLKQAILQSNVEQPIIFDRIFFFSGSDLLNPESSNQILGVAGIMNTYKDFSIKLRGHTDSLGVVDDNLALSFKRSQNLKDQLVGLGIDKNRIQVEGMGSSEPISDNQSEEGRSKNRRIDLTIIR